VKYVVRALAMLCVVALVAAGSRAEEKKADEKKSAAERTAFLFSFPKQVTLTAEQQTKLDALKTEYTPRLEELHAKNQKLMTGDREKTAREAARTAREAGKKGPEVQEAVEAALKLTPEEKTQMTALRTEREALMKKIREAKMGLLTEEQKASLPKPKQP